jgi:hypothetical protein
MQREEMELLAVRATLGRMEIEILRRYRFAKRGHRFGSDVELMIVYGAAIAHYGLGTPVRALPISRYLEMPRETVRRHMGRLVALGLLERAEDQTFVPTEELRKVEIERALRLLRRGLRGYCDLLRYAYRVPLSGILPVLNPTSNGASAIRCSRSNQRSEEKDLAGSTNGCSRPRASSSKPIVNHHSLS